jgi:hypothetical protein
MSDTTLMTDETIPVGGNQQTAEPTGGQPASTGDATNQQQTQGQSGDGQQQGTQDNQGNNQKAPEGAPENYEFKAPEGHEYDSSVINAFSEAAKELNLTQEAADKMLNKMAPLIAERQIEQIEAVQTKWADESKVDKEFGGDKLDENLKIAKGALEKFGSPELSKLLKETGAGNNPEIIRLLYRVGKATGEDKVVPGSQGAPAGESRSAAAILYDKSAQQQ